MEKGNERFIKFSEQNETKHKNKTFQQLTYINIQLQISKKSYKTSEVRLL